MDDTDFANSSSSSPVSSVERENERREEEQLQEKAKQQLTGEKSWQLVKRSRIYQLILSSGRAREIGFDPDTGKYGQDKRWRTVIPVDSKIVYLDDVEGDNYCTYVGNAHVVDHQTRVKCSLSEWCKHAHLVRSKRTSSLSCDGTVVVEGKPPSISAPQACSVVLCDLKSGEKVAVRLKVFDYIYLEDFIMGFEESHSSVWGLVYAEDADFDDYTGDFVAHDCGTSPQIQKSPNGSISGDDDNVWQGLDADAIWHKMCLENTDDDNDNNRAATHEKKEEVHSKAGLSALPSLTGRGTTSSRSLLGPPHPSREQHFVTTDVLREEYACMPAKKRMRTSLPTHEMSVSPEENIFHSQVETIRRVYLVAYDGKYKKGDDKHEKLTPEQKRALWDICYGKGDTHPCMMCQRTMINFSSSCSHAAHVIARSKDGQNTRVWNYLITCSDCNKGDKSIFDQADACGRLFVVRHFVDVLLAAYCYAEAYLNYQFTSRLDFVKRIYGYRRDPDPEFRGGEGSICSARVIAFIDALDKEFPLSLKMLNPLLRSL